MSEDGSIQYCHTEVVMEDTKEVAFIKGKAYPVMVSPPNSHLIALRDEQGDPHYFYKSQLHNYFTKDDPEDG